MVVSPWPAAGRSLDTTFKKEMFYHQGFDNDKFWKAFIPTEEKFFGVKSLNIFIAQKPYGWTDHGTNWVFDAWPPPGMIADLEAFKASGIDNFTDYKTQIWVDMWTAEEIKRRNPGSEMPDMMLQTDAKLHELTDTYRFLQYMGQLHFPQEGSFFKEGIKDFFGKPAYRKPEEV